jgi:hypothetical protein
VIHWEGKRQVEVAIIKSAIPSYANLMATHQPCDCLGIKGFPKELQIILFLLFPDQVCPKAPQRHIGDGEKAGESDPKTLAQLAPVILFKIQLGRRQKRPSRVVDKVQRQAGFGAVAQAVQSSDGFYASLINSSAPLGTYVLLEIARQGSHELNPVVPEKLRQTPHVRFQKHCQIGSNLDPVTLLTEGFYKTAEIRVKLRGSSGQVNEFAIHSFGGL